eukprot:227284_1
MSSSSNYIGNESTFMLQVPYDTQRKLFGDQGYPTSDGLFSEYDYHLLTIYGFSIFRKSTTISKLLIADIITIQGVANRVRIAKEDAEIITYLPAVVQEEKIFRSLTRNKWLTMAEVNHYRMNKNYRPKYCRDARLYHKTIRFDGTEGTVHKVRVLGVDVHQFIGQIDSEYKCRLSTSNVHIPECLLFETQKEAQQFTIETENEDLLQLLYFNSLESAVANKIDISKVIESSELPEWLQIRSPFYNKKEQWLLYQDTNAEHYFLQRSINEILLQFTNPTIISASYALKMTGYNIAKYGVAISYNALKEMMESNMNCVRSIVTHIDYIEFKIDMSNTDLDTTYSDFKKGHKNKVVSNEVTIRYIRKYEALLMTDFSLQTSRI